MIHTAIIIFIPTVLAFFGWGASLAAGADETKAKTKIAKDRALVLAWIGLFVIIAAVLVARFG